MIKKLREIQTASDMYALAGIWRQRADKLRGIWQNMNESQDRRRKALILFEEMKWRIIKMVETAASLDKATWRRQRSIKRIWN
ncbi:hypothetical protein [Sunxiuqinia indica]|uniref:hypothetical protein n=1 Tax=Sunxiuqinia indica TaxID=2692584 RepID=UPI00135C4A3E|nr:hypothetical protein [Sunxiuqinia indica]